MNSKDDIGLVSGKIFIFFFIEREFSISNGSTSNSYKNIAVQCELACLLEVNSYCL